MHESHPAELDPVTKRYGMVEALRGLDLTIRKGELLALLGENGPGCSSRSRSVDGVSAPLAATLLACEALSSYLLSLFSPTNYQPPTTN